MAPVNDRYSAGYVYSMTNSANGNQIVAFSRNEEGKLIFLDAFDTGGSGSGEAVVDPLASQGSLILSRSGNHLFAVNAGSNTISSFLVDDCGALIIKDVEPSCGTRPNSLAVHEDLLYVTNVGNPERGQPSNVAGFRVDKDGCLTRIKCSVRPLSSPNAQPACVVFNPRIPQIIVSESNTNVLSVFHVNRDGTLNGPTVNQSSGAGPFGSVFLNSGILLVSEAGANALSSYSTASGNRLRIISASVKNGQQATCWVSAIWYEKFAFTSNTGSGTISTFQIHDNGALSLLRIDYSTLRELAAPIDSGVSRDGCNFYVLNGNQGSITVFAIGKNGILYRLQVVKNTGLPTLGAQGLAVL